MAVKRNGQDEAEAEAATAPSQAGAPKSHTPKATAPKASARSRTARKATNDPPAPTASTTKAPPSKAPTPKAKGSAPTPPGVTPSIARFLEIKAANPDSLLFYRMGDFYELFFEDAVAAAAALNIVLTKRGQHLGKEIPMCGVPVARADEYLQRLIRAGFRVAVCEQMEDPAEAKKRGANAVVRRDVVRLVTPGTLTEDTLLEGHASNFLTALFVRGGKDASRSANGDTGSDKQGDPTRRQSAKADATGDAGMVALASIDISTGDTELACLARADLAGELARLSPREILIADRLNEDAAWRARLDATGAAITPLPQAHFSAGHGERALTQRLGVATLGAFGAFTRDELAAAGALMTYIDLTQLGATPVIRTPRRVEADTIMLIDAASRASLELTRTASGARQGSLLHALDRTVTGAGARELAARLTGPLRDPRAIRARLDAVGYFVERERLRSDLRGCLKRTPDLARAVARLSFNRGGPRDLQSVRDALHAADALHALLQSDAMAMGLPAVLHEVSATLQAADGELRVALSALLADEVPVHRREGGFVREGYNGELDEARALRDDSRAVMAGLEARYAEVTGVRGLKVRHNNILGFFIEVSAAQADALMAPPHAQTFIHRQTMANAMRFRTDELTALEGKIAAAADRAIALELTLFNEAASMIAQAQALLHALAQALAVLDHYAGLAELAVEQRYRRPDIDEGTGFEIIGGRHAVVEQALARQRDGSGGPFIANDCTLGRFIPAPTGFDEAPTPHIWLVTGPNMAGKSTFLRLLLAQERPTRGEIRIDGAVPAKEPGLDRGIVFQKYSVFPHM
ncbi:MAG: DNA mismatch repair protein MutS, partial [Pseudomonadota bacterium]